MAQQLLHIPRHSVRSGSTFGVKRCLLLLACYLREVLWLSGGCFKIAATSSLCSSQSNQALVVSFVEFMFQKLETLDLKIADRFRF